MNLLLDHLNYTSYYRQRSSGMSAEECAKLYANAAALELRYQSDLKERRN